MLSHYGLPLICFWAGLFYPEFLGLDMIDFAVYLLASFLFLVFGGAVAVGIIFRFLEGIINGFQRN